MGVGLTFVIALMCLLGQKEPQRGFSALALTLMQSRTVGKSFLVSGLSCPVGDVGVRAAPPGRLAHVPKRISKYGQWLS